MRQLTSVEQKLNFLVRLFGMSVDTHTKWPQVSTVTSYGDAATVAPSLLADSFQLLSNFQSQTPDNLTSRKSTSAHATNNGLQPFCNCRPRTRQSAQYRWWIPFLTEETYQHYSTCPYSVHADYSRSVAAQMTICSGLLSFCVQAGLKRSKRGGWNSIAPILRYRAVVPQGTGAFKILQDAKRAIIDSRPCSQQKFTDILTTATTSLQRTFQTIASPYHLEESGSCLLDVCPPLREPDCITDRYSLP